MTTWSSVASFNSRHIWYDTQSNDIVMKYLCDYLGVTDSDLPDNIFDNIKMDPLFIKEKYMEQITFAVKSWISACFGCKYTRDDKNNLVASVKNSNNSLW